MRERFKTPRKGGVLSLVVLGLACVACSSAPSFDPPLAAKTCGEWERLNSDEQLATADALVVDRLEVVREQQHLPPDATGPQIVAAARGSIDKVCQGEGPGALLVEVVTQLYRVTSSN